MALTTVETPWEQLLNTLYKVTYSLVKQQLTSIPARAIY